MGRSARDLDESPDSFPNKSFVKAATLGLKVRNDSPPSPTPANPEGKQHNNDVNGSEALGLDLMLQG